VGDGWSARDPSGAEARRSRKNGRRFLDDRDLGALTSVSVVHQASPSTIEWTSSEEGTMPAKKKTVKKVAKKPVKKAAKKKTSKK
jgi:hypothetical protein